MYLSAAGPQTSIKALRAVLHTKKMVFDLSLSRHEPDTGGEDGDVEGGTRLYRAGDGYTIRTHHLGLNVHHLVAVADTPGLLMSLDEESVWQALLADRFTTPLLREWMPYLVEQLLIENAIRRPEAYGCAPAVLLADDAVLDEIVRRGLNEGTITI
jgi:hypothetical protein